MSNALAALALCRALGIAWPALLYAVRGYTGEPHRMQFLMNIAHVDYFDDSKGTNVGATQAALGGLAKEYKKIVLIAGGDGKEQDFAPLKVLITEHTRAVCLIGKDAKKIAQAIGDVSKIIFCQTLLEAAEKAAQEAQEGDAVLLSPACASFDMFSNYVHRAQVYKQAVEEIAATRGIVLS